MAPKVTHGMPSGPAWSRTTSCAAFRKVAGSLATIGAASFKNTESGTCIARALSCLATVAFGVCPRCAFTYWVAKERWWRRTSASMHCRTSASTVPRSECGECCSRQWRRIAAATYVRPGNADEEPRPRTIEEPLAAKKRAAPSGCRTSRCTNERVACASNGGKSRLFFFANKEEDDDAGAWSPTLPATPTLSLGEEDAEDEEEEEEGVASPSGCEGGGAGEGCMRCEAARRARERSSALAAF